MRNVTMLHRIDMDVIGMPFEIALIPDLVFPKTSLPYRRFAAAFHGR